jgi:hypothetical protein
VLFDLDLRSIGMEFALRDGHLIWGDDAVSKQRALWWEAIRAHPGAYVGGVSQSLWDLLWKIRMWATVPTDAGSPA